MSNKHNFFVTLILIFICFSAAILIPNIGVAISITGATINPFIGFIFPIMYFVKLDPSPMRSKEKVVAIIILVFICAVSIIGLVTSITKAAL